MSFKAKLKVAGKEYNVLSVSYALFQETDATGRPSTEAYLVKHREHFDASGEKPLTESFTISARKLEMGTGAYENEWV